jgi:hypothetical protein
MDEMTLIEMIARLISSSGAATFDTLRRELGSADTPDEVRDALRIACARGLLKADTSGGSAAEPRYQLTLLAIDMLEPPQDQASPQRERSTPAPTSPARAIDLSRVLAVLAEFDQFGGASVELVAWELSVDVSAIARGWSRAVTAGLVEQAGIDELHEGERLWRLTEAGRRAVQSNCGASS